MFPILLPKPPHLPIQFGFKFHVVFLPIWETSSSAIEILFREYLFTQMSGQWTTCFVLVVSFFFLFLFRFYIKVFDPLSIFFEKLKCVNIVSFFCRCISSFTSSICWPVYIFPTLYFLPPLSKLYWQSFVQLFPFLDFILLLYLAAFIPVWDCISID